MTFPLNLAAGQVTIKNLSSDDKLVSVYVPNRDYMSVAIPAKETLTVTTRSAGETFYYLNQATEDIEVNFQ